jgi:hypothetical protein
MRCETVTYRGTTFRRYPDAKHWTDRTYFKASPGKLLHLEVYKAEVGPIPSGHEIHHRDWDAANNARENLQLVTREEHHELHRQRLREKAIERNQIAIAQAAAKEWHQSDAGRAWHSEKAKAEWARRKPAEHTCRECGKSFTSRKSHNVLFCHQNCKQKARRKRLRI